MKIEKLFKGRLGRMDYFIIHFIILIPIVLLFILFGLIQFVVALSGVDSANSMNDFMSWVLPGLAIIIFLPLYFLMHFSLAIRRAHDLGKKTGVGVILAIVMLIPYIGIIPGLYLLFVKGDEKENEFGVPNESSVWKNIFNQ